MKYFDKNLNREFNIPSFDNVTLEDLHKNYKKEVFNAMYEAVVMMIEANTKFIPCMLVNELVFCINEESLNDNIDYAIDYFVDTEEYEKCQKLNDIKRYMKKH